VGFPTVTSGHLSGKLCHPLAQTSSYATGQKLLFCHACAELFCNISLHGKRTLSNRDRFVLQFRPKLYLLFTPRLPPNQISLGLPQHHAK